MINSTNTVNIDGTVVDDETLKKALDFNSKDRFTRWLVRPAVLLTVVGLGIAAFTASAFLILFSLMMSPILALGVWVMKTKMERDLAQADPVVDTQSAEEIHVSADASH